MKIIDAFIFYNEEKMLDFRLNYYAKTVDYFVIVESTKTFSGEDKPLYFDKIKNKYSNFNIIHYIVDKMPTEGAWEREHYQRECINEGLKLIPDIQDEDWVLIADVDEIANRHKLHIVQTNNYYNSSDKKGYTLEFDNYYYNFNCKLDQKCYATKLLRYSEIKDKEIKNLRFSLKYPLLIEFGWHLSYFLSPELIQKKIASFSHQEYNNEKFNNLEHINDCINTSKIIFHLDPNFKAQINYIPIEENKNLPEGYEALM